MIVLANAACSTTSSVQQTVEEVNIECSFEMQAARTAIRLRDKGKPESSLKAQLVPLDEKSSRLLIKMHEITDEVYAATGLNEVVYSTYRFELCQREFLQKPRPASIDAVLPDLLKCQDKYANKSSVNSTNCILAAIDNNSLHNAVTNEEIK